MSSWAPRRGRLQAMQSRCGACRQRPQGCPPVRQVPLLCFSCLQSCVGCAVAQAVHMQHMRAQADPADRTVLQLRRGWSMCCTRCPMAPRSDLSSQHNALCAQGSRDSLLADAADQGVVDGCSGRRRTMKGREFEFHNGTLFNVDGADGGLLTRRSADCPALTPNDGLPDEPSRSSAAACSHGRKWPAVCRCCADDPAGGPCCCSAGVPDCRCQQAWAPAAVAAG